MPDRLYDPEIIAHYRELSASGLHFRGLSLLPYEQEITRLIYQTGSRSLLDYGCGAGDQYKRHRLHEKWNITDLFLYDPGVATRCARPDRKFDFVICSDVMEHVPRELVDNVLRDIFSFAEKHVWLSICCRPAKKFFPDGRNLHLTLESSEWWNERVSVAAGGVPGSFTLVFTQ